jgi:hypothetical protein
VGNTTVTARDHVAEVALNRGGSVRVCATSGLHVTAGKSVSGMMPLMLALDRGAIEVRMAANTSDVVMTPDLRFTMRADGPLDLRLRVIQNGDTCVENRGDKAPTLHVVDQFGDSTYELRAGQHVLFEHGSLKEVVDHETTPCGCPPMPVVSVADAGVTSNTPASAGSAVATEQQHPFPAAVSEGLAPGAAVPQAPAGVVHAQVATTLSYNEGEPPSAPVSSTKAATDSSSSSSTTPAAATVTAQAPAAPEAVQQRDVVHAIGRFFKRLFGHG